MHIGPIGDLGIVGGEPESAGSSVPSQQRLQSDLIDVGPAGGQGGHSGRIDVNADHLVPELGHPGCVSGTQIVGADDTDPQSHADECVTVAARSAFFGGCGGQIAR